MSTLSKGLKHRGIQVFLFLTLYFLFAASLPRPFHEGLYTVSILIKDLLIWILPITVAFFIASSVISFERKAPIFVLAIVLFEALSNFSSVCYSFFAGHLVADALPAFHKPEIQDDLSVIWRLPAIKPAWWSVDKGSLVGLAVGLFGAIFKHKVTREVVVLGKGMAEFILTRVFAPLIPIFVLGFVARIYETRLLVQVFELSGILVLSLLIFLSVYIAFLFFLSGDGTVKSALQHLKNLLPAGSLAFSSGCSISTMPWTMAGAGKNMKDPDFAKAVIPATTNIQQIGDCITNTFLCFLIYRHFFGVNPDLATWLQFSVVFVLARFATAAVIGGAIFVMLPVYEHYLYFTPEMIAIILAFNVVLDPIVTSSNVLANGALCRLFEKVWKSKIFAWG